MTAYKQACQKLNCKQIPKVLKQIQVESKDASPLRRSLEGGGARVAGGTADPHFKRPGGFGDGWKPAAGSESEAARSPDAICDFKRRQTLVFPSRSRRGSGQGVLQLDRQRVGTEIPAVPLPRRLGAGAGDAETRDVVFKGRQRLWFSPLARG